MGTRARIGLGAALAGLLVLGSWLMWRSDHDGFGPGAGGAGSTADVIELAAIGELQEAFDADAGHPRLVLLVDPL